MNRLTSSLQIERVEAPTLEYFEQNYVNRNRPVILTGVASRWRAMSKWNPAYLKSVAGESIVTVHFQEHGDFFQWYLSPSQRIEQKITLGEFIRWM